MAENNEDKKYDLYTEHIVPGNGRKVKKMMKKAGAVLGLAVIFGVVAGLVMIIIYRNGSKMFPPEHEKIEATEITLANKPTDPTTQDDITTAETTTQDDTKETTAVSIEYETTPAEPETLPERTDEESKVLEQVRDFHEALKTVVAQVDCSCVKIKAVESTTDYQNVVDGFGVIIASDEESYFILTEYENAYTSGDIRVTFNNKQVVDAWVVAGDTVSDLLVLKAQKAESEIVKPVQFGASDKLMLGDAVIAVGSLYGMGENMGYGLVTDLHNATSYIDAEYDTIGTNIGIGVNGFGILSNIDGEIVGVISNENNVGDISLARAYTIKSVESLLERLINAKPFAYIGIQGQSATETIQEDYGVPAGVYVTAVQVGSPAYSAGIQTGDVISSIDGTDVENMNDYMKITSKLAGSEGVDFVIKRKSRDAYKEIVFSVAIGVQ